MNLCSLTVGHNLLCNILHLQTQVQTLSGQIERISDTQRTLQEKIDCYNTDKEILLEELEKYGLITDQLR